MANNEFNIENATMAQVNDAMGQANAKLREFISNAKKAGGMFNSGALSEGQLARAKDVRKTRDAEIKSAYNAGNAWERMDIADRSRGAQNNYLQRKYLAEAFARIDRRKINIDRTIGVNPGGGSNTRDTDDQILGMLPKVFRNNWKMGRQAFNMAGGLSRNPVANFNDARDIFEYAQSISGPINTGVSAVGAKISNLAKNMSGVSKTAAGSIGNALYAAGTAAIPTGVGLGVAAAVAAIPLAIAASIKLDTMQAETYRTQYDTNTSWMKASNSLANQFGRRIDMSVVQSQVLQSMSDLDKTKKLADMNSSVPGRILKNYLGGTPRSDYANSGTWITGDSTGAHAARVVGNILGWGLEKVFGSGPTFKSQADIDTEIRNKSKELINTFAEQAAAAESLVLDGNVAVARRTVNTSLLNQSAELKNKVEVVMTPNVAGRMYRLSEESKNARRRFAFQFDDWQAARND